MIGSDPGDLLSDQYVQSIIDENRPKPMRLRRPQRDHSLLAWAVIFAGVALGVMLGLLWVR